MGRIGLAAFVALIVVIAIVAPAEETDEPTTADQAADEPETEFHGKRRG
jgi:hypothetical protein